MRYNYFTQSKTITCERMRAFKLFTTLLSFVVVSAEAQTITGKIISKYKADHLDIKATGIGAGKSLTVNPDNTYSFTGLIGENAKFGIKSEKDYLNGVNVGDIIAISNHILGKKHIITGEGFIAADVTIDGSLSVSDIVEIRKLILGRSDRFRSEHSYRFIDASFPLFSNNWFLAPDFIIAGPEDKSNADFVAVKLGDVENMFFDGEDKVAIRNDRRPVITVSSADDYGTFEVHIKNMTSLEGLQFELDIDPQLYLARINAGIDENTFSISDDRTAIRVLLTAQDIHNLHGQPLFTFNSGNIPDTGEPIRLDPSFENVAFEADGSPFQPAIAYQHTARPLISIAPNPFRDATYLSFETEQADHIELSISNIKGQIIYSSAIESNSGQNTVLITRENLNHSSGILFYHLTGPNTSTSGKLIMLD